MEASIADLYQKELAFLNKNFMEGSVIEEKFYGIFYGGQDQGRIQDFFYLRPKFEQKYGG